MPKDVRPEGAAIALNSEDLMEWLTDLAQLAVDKIGIRRMATELIRRIFTWGMRWSLYPLHFGIMCCALEMASAGASRFDTQRFGILYRSSPRQCDVLLLTGPVSHKLKPSILRLWEQTPEPKWVVAMGECNISGGPYYDSYSVINGTDEFLPVDVYIPGCPPRPEAFIDGFLKLQKLIKESGKKPVWRKGWKPRVPTTREDRLPPEPVEEEKEAEEAKEEEAGEKT